MGIFSSSSVVTVASMAVNLVADPGDLHTSSVITSVLRGTSIAEDLVENSLNSVALKVDRALAYAETSYTNGLPEGYLQKAVGDDAAVTAVLTGIEGAPVMLLSSIVQQSDNSTYTWDDSTTTTGLVSGEMYYYVLYAVIDSAGEFVGEIKKWTYRVSLGTYPTLALADDQAMNSPYYPIIPIRKDNVDLTDSSLSATPLHQTSTELVKILGHDFASLGEGVNSNPSVADIDHALLMFGVDISSDRPASIRYMYEYFKYMHELKEFTSLDYTLWRKSIALKINTSKLTTININDGYIKMQVNFTHSDLDVITGSIGDVGTITKDIVILPRGMNRVAKGDKGVWNIYTYERSTITFKEQISPTKYLELVIHGPQHSNYVYGAHSVESTLATAADPDNYSFILPLNKYIVDNMTTSDKTDLMYDSVKLLFQSYEITKVSWYQSGFFQFVISIAAIAITVVSMGTASPWATALVASLGVAAGTVAFTVLAMIVDMIIGQMLMFAFKLFTKVVGIENSFLAALATMATTMFLTKGKLTVKSIAGAPWASELLMVSNGILTGIQANVAEAMDELSDAYTTFWEYSENKMDRLTEAQAVFDASNASELLDPYTFVSPIAFDPNESPSQYYSRTIHAGNIGVLSLDATASYVANSLRLPSTIDSGSFNNLLGV